MIRMKKLLTIALIALGCALVSPSVSQAQGRGHGRGLEKKSFRFINGHDARDGRWDGRGPRMNRRMFWDNGFFGRRVHRGRHHRFDRDFDRDDDFFFRRGHVRRHRFNDDFDRDGFRRFDRVDRFERRDRERDDEGRGFSRGNWRRRERR